jgi:indole-3-glycerol phosphate synthase
MSHLADILEAKHVAVAALREQPRTTAARPRKSLDVIGALRRAPGTALRLIAEVKLRSPSAGPLSRALAPAERAVAYAEAGASMVSVLCDARFFDGAWEHLEASRASLDAAGRAVPLLAKDFVVDERQIEEARDRGADAVLLIARIVSRSRLGELADAARAAGIEPLVEVVEEAEIEAAIAARARVFGVNARDLDTLKMDAARAARLLAAIPRDSVAVHLSGLRSDADVAAIARERPDAALIGEALMREDDPRGLLAAMVRAAGSASNFTR